MGQITTIGTIEKVERNPNVDNPSMYIDIEQHGGGGMFQLHFYDMPEFWPVGREVEIKVRLISEDELHPCH